MRSFDDSGAAGAWGLGASEEYASRWAAIAPVRGALRSRGLRHGALALAATPIWAFHGADDINVPVAISDAPVAACAGVARGAPLRYTRPQFGGRDHVLAHAYYPPDISASARPPLYLWPRGYLPRQGRGDAAAATRIVL